MDIKGLMMKKISYYFLFLLVFSVYAQKQYLSVNSRAKKLKTDIINLKNGQKIQGTIIEMTEEDLTIVTINDDGIETFSVYLKDDIRNFEIFTETKRTEKEGRTTSLIGWTLCLCTSPVLLVVLLAQLRILGN